MLALSLSRLKGALGTVYIGGITAPEPAEDSAESPTALIAITFALTEVPVVRLNGEARSTVTGMEHVLVVKTTD